MKSIALAMVAGLGLALGAGAASAAQAPAPTVATVEIAGMQGVQLPAARKAAAAKEIVVAQRRGGGRRIGGRGGRRVVRGGRRRGRIGTGGKIAIGAAILGAALIASQAARADDDYGRTCRRWRRQCRRGSDRACWRYENRC